MVILFLSYIQLSIRIKFHINRSINYNDIQQNDTRYFMPLIKVVPESFSYIKLKILKVLILNLLSRFLINKFIINGKDSLEKMVHDVKISCHNCDTSYIGQN